MTALQIADTRIVAPIVFGKPILAEAMRRLRSNCHQEIRLVSVTVRGVDLILHGTVSSFYLKQIAQTVVRGVDGVRKIKNRLDVVYPDATQGDTR